MRLRDFDYSTPTAYFVTICSHERRLLFGSISNQNLILNEFGKVVEITWRNLNHFFSIDLDEFVVMPNHFHGIVILKDNFKDPNHSKNSSLISIIQIFKSQSTKRIHSLGNTQQIWQRSYHDIIIRDNDHLNATREYIRNNPINWELDSEHKKSSVG